MTDAHEIAGKLIRGEKEALFALPKTCEWWPKNARHHLGPDHPRDGLFYMWANRSPLVEGRGYTTGFVQNRLTPLGLRVRAILEGQK